MLDLTLREFFDRYGPTLAVVAALALLAVLVPTSGDGDGEVVAGSTTDTGPSATVAGQQATRDTVSTPSRSTGGGSAVTSGAASTDPAPVETASDALSDGAAALDSGTEGIESEETIAPSDVSASDYGPGVYPPPTPETQCRDDGALPGFDRYMPPCTPVFPGPNAGDTGSGVSEDKVRVVRFLGNPNPVESATLQALGVDDPEPVRDRADRALTHYFANHVETYGREIEVITFQGTGGDDDDEAARADAIDIADMDVFAVFAATPTGINAPVLGEELAARGVLCMCTTSEGKSYYKRNMPYIWSTLPDMEEYFSFIAEYWGKRLNGTEAKWADGDQSVPPLDTSTRKFGLIYIEGSGDRVDPEVQEALAHFNQELTRYGVELTESQGYTLDLARGQEQAINIMAKMKSAGVTTLACFCDPLTPVFFYEEATRSTYFPENFITGSILMDTTFFGRTYDKKQWENAFGISPLWVFFEDVSTSAGYRHFHHGDTDQEPGDEGIQINVRNAPIRTLMLGIHYAGPELTPENFQKGYIAAGRMGGGVKAPLVYYSKDSSTAYKDFTEVWWNPSQQGKDETGQEGVGGLMKSNGGARFELGEWPEVDQPPVFGDDPQPVFTSDEPPETFDHDADGHTHGDWDQDDRQVCRSC